MKVRSIPAQITSVEDKIAGNLTLTQIILLMIPVFWCMIVYTLFLPQMQLSWYKLPLITLVIFACLILALRIKGKVMLHWLGIIFTYNSRPKYYVCDKNDAYLRELPLLLIEKAKRKARTKSIQQTREVVTETRIAIDSLVRFEHALTNPNISFSIKANRKGGLNVSLEQKQ